MYEWKIRVAKNLKELEQLVESIQLEGWTIEKIDVKTVSVVAYRAKGCKEQLLTEDGPEWIDRDYGQQKL